jgi:26S proteasome regulatory subunit T6
MCQHFPGVNAANSPQTYYRNKIEAAEHEITKKTQNLRRLEAQRNTLNTRGVLLTPPQ